MMLLEIIAGEGEKLKAYVKAPDKKAHRLNKG